MLRHIRQDVDEEDEDYDGRAVINGESSVNTTAISRAGVKWSTEEKSIAINALNSLENKEVPKRQRAELVSRELEKKGYLRTIAACEIKLRKRPKSLFEDSDLSPIKRRRLIPGKDNSRSHGGIASGGLNEGRRVDPAGAGVDRRMPGDFDFPIDIDALDSPMKSEFPQSPALEASHVIKAEHVVKAESTAAQDVEKLIQSAREERDDMFTEVDEYKGMIQEHKRMVLEKSLALQLVKDRLAAKEKKIVDLENMLKHLS